ncbi:MAG: site-2 protease family protein [Ruminococcaceae bacterium]|nr:site-2 protease family protein [Oscillospiraceae bacterium]
MYDSLFDFLIELIIIAPIVLIALTFHECAHGFVAYKLGDPTAKYMGRLSLNPLKHIDPIGALCMLLVHFGWAKPVPIDITNFTKPRRDLALSALGGPVANLLLGFVGCFFYTLTLHLLPNEVNSKLAYELLSILVTFVYYFGWLNISLALFNLLPIPPLDGSKILYAFLPPRASNWCKMHEREVGAIFLVVLLLDSRLLGGHITGVLSLGVNAVFNLFTNLFNLLF